MDINLFVDHVALGAALDVIEGAGVSLDRAAAVAADAEGELIVGWHERLRVDLFTPSIPFSWEAMWTRVSVEGPRGRAYYLSAEATVIFKLLFFRSKDLADVERLVAVQGVKLDRAYVRGWMVDMVGEGDGRVVAWDRIVADQTRAGE